MAAAEAGAPSGTVLVAERQTAGRGRRGRSWFSAPGDSLTFSVLWRFAVTSAAPAALSLAVGLAVARACEELGGTGVGLKWPNDLLHDGRKLAGILIELVPADPRAAVIGIGLNLRLPADLPDELGASAAALDQFLPTVPMPERVLAQLLQSLATTLDVYAEHGFAALRQDWLARDAYRGRPVRILSEFGADRHGLCAGIDADGALLLDTAAGRERLISGEISLRPGP
jgi:BirA family biotin operon repressor/biotin-[acetyl-CoA-carboxylase] ligase